MMGLDALDVVLIVIGLVMACVSIAAIMGRRKTVRLMDLADEGANVP
jgi:hypothetical protein